MTGFNRPEGPMSAIPQKIVQNKVAGDSAGCFKAYDIRVKLGEELNEDIVYRIGRAYARFLRPHKVVVGGDVRLTSEALKLALSNGLRDEGVDVIDIGLCGTEEIYFATSYLNTDGGIVVTASHNPIDYNGMKMVREGSRPISGDSGLHDIKQLAEINDFGEPAADGRGSYRQESVLEAYVQHLLSYVDVSQLKPLKLVVNAGNGAAGHVIDALEPHLPFEFVKVHHQPDGNFPNGIPNPLLPENRAATSDAVPLDDQARAEDALTRLTRAPDALDDPLLVSALPHAFERFRRAALRGRREI
jgi:phosphomannomutase